MERGAPSWKSRPDRELEPGWVRLRLVLAGLCGTDWQLLQGYADFAGVLGHEFVARVVEVCHPTEAAWLGQAVVGEINVGCQSCPLCQQGREGFCDQRRVLGIRDLDGVLGDSFVLPLRNLHPVGDLAPELACWCEPLAAAWEVVPHLPPEKEVLVIGDGRLGGLIALALQSLGREVVVLGRQPSKLERLSQLGLRTLRSAQPGWAALVEASGTPQGLEQALELARPQATIVVKSTLAHPGPICWNPVVLKSLHLVGSRCGPFAPALAALRAGRIDPRPLVEAVYPLGQLPQALAARHPFKTLITGPDADGAAGESR